MHTHLSKESAKSTYLSFGRELFRCVGLAFGLTISPGLFQQMNRVMVNFLNLHGHKSLLYLDDRYYTLIQLDLILELDYYLRY